MSARPQLTGGACGVAWVDGPGLAPRILFFSPAEYPAAYLSTEARMIDPIRGRRVTGTAEGQQFLMHTTFHDTSFV